jgi:hypothetical protein
MAYSGKRRLDANIVTFDRETFIHDVWDYIPGDHVTVLAPTGGGKTQLAYELLGATAKPNLQATVFVMKPRDETVSKFTAKYGFKIIRDWPPPRLRLFDKKPPGYVLWPRETGNPDADDANQERIFRSALRDLYRKGHKIAFADETYSLEKELGMEKELRRLWTKGRSMDTGLWAASQRPVWISRWAFQAQHLFLGNDPDVDMQKRYGEIGGGIDPDIVREVTGRLKRYEFVYISREERTMCVVSAS